MFHTNSKFILVTLTFLVVSYSYGSCIPSSSKHINCTTTPKPGKIGASSENQTEPVAEPESKTKSYDSKNTIPAKLKAETFIETTTPKLIGNTNSTTKIPSKASVNDQTTPTTAVSANVTEVANMTAINPTISAPLKIEDREGKSLNLNKTEYEHASPEPEPEAEPEKNATVSSKNHPVLKSSKLTNENTTASSKPNSSAQKPGSGGSDKVVVNEMFLIVFGLSLFLQ